MDRLYAALLAVLAGCAFSAAAFAEDGRQVPEWVRDAAVWWGLGLVDDSEFFGLVGFLVEEGLIAAGPGAPEIRDAYDRGYADGLAAGEDALWEYVDGSLGRLSFVEGASLSVVTEGSAFGKGERVAVRIVNTGTAPLTFGSASYGLVITGPSGGVVYEPVAAAVMSHLGPGEEARGSWDQIHSDGRPVGKGLYKIHAGGHDQNFNAVGGSATVAVLG